MTSDIISNNLLDRVSATIQQYRLLENGDRVIVAVSGGVDSLSLLHLLHILPMSLDLVAVYIDHGWRPDETPLEEENIKHRCDRFKIPFFIEKINVTLHCAETGSSPEESARLLRYQVLEKIRFEQKAQSIAVGHTSDDQVEEFFIRLIRGSSTRGLSGMLPRNRFIIRPLLFEQKDTLESFLKEQGVKWNIDSSNRDRRFLRNRVRLDLLPLLEKKFNPSIRKNVLRNMDILQEEDHCMEQHAATAYDRVVTWKVTDLSDRTGEQLRINKDLFGQLHQALARRVIEKCCWKMGARPTYAQICSLSTLIKREDNSGEIHLQDGLRAVNEPGAVTLSRPLKNGRLRGSEEPLPSISLSVPAPGRYLLPETDRELILLQQHSSDQLPDDNNILRVDMDKVTFPLLLRSSLPGEKFHPYNGPGRKKISRYFNDRKVPARKRPSYPLLLCGEKVVAIAGLQIDHHFRVSNTTENILLISWRRPETETTEDR